LATHFLKPGVTASVKRTNILEIDVGKAHIGDYPSSLTRPALPGPDGLAGRSLAMMERSGRIPSSLFASASYDSASSGRQCVSPPLARLGRGPTYDGIPHPPMEESNEVEC